ncbi:MAG TPA: hypothetical protein VGB37_08100 [Candidatus Lokiarchaeia archaeon]
MELTSVELLNGILSLILVIISIIIGIKISSKYLIYKQKLLLYVGITWVLIVSIWYSSSISVLLILTTKQRLSDELYMLIGNVPLPIALFIWMIVFIDVVNKKFQKLVLIIFGIYVILFEIFFLYFLFTDKSVLGEIVSPVDATYSLVITACQLFDALLFFTTGIIFSITSLKSETKEIKLKGKLIMIAYILMLIGVLLELISNLSIILLVLARLVLVFCGFSYYGGFILPDWMKKLLLRKKA